MVAYSVTQWAEMVANSYRTLADVPDELKPEVKELLDRLFTEPIKFTHTAYEYKGGKLVDWNPAEEELSEKAKRMLGTEHEDAGSGLGDLAEALRRLEEVELLATRSESTCVCRDLRQSIRMTV